MSIKTSKFKSVSAPCPDNLAKFLDNPIPANRGHSNFAEGGPPFRPVTTLRGGAGGGFGTGGGFGSTGGFHTMRLAPWEEPSLIPLDPRAPPLVENAMPKDRPSQWAPSVCATAVAHTVNQVRAEQEGVERLRAVVEPELVAPPVQPSDGGAMLIMEPERFALMRVSVPAPRRVAPPDNYGKPADALWTPEERRTLLEFEKAKRLADTVGGAAAQRRVVCAGEAKRPRATLAMAAERRRTLAHAQWVRGPHQRRTPRAAALTGL